MTDEFCFHVFSPQAWTLLGMASFAGTILLLNRQKKSVLVFQVVAGTAILTIPYVLLTYLAGAPSYFIPSFPSLDCFLPVGWGIFAIYAWSTGMSVIERCTPAVTFFLSPWSVSSFVWKGRGPLVIPMWPILLFLGLGVGIWAFARIQRLYTDRDN